MPVEGDKRFEFMVKQSSASVDPYSDDFLEHDEMEKLGFSENQRVKLRRIPLPASDDDTESVDALDVAISMEELGDEVEDSALFDGGSASATRGTVSTHPTSHSGKKSTKKSSGGSRKKTGKPPTKLSKRKSPVPKKKVVAF